jgi:hypothetical protein
MSQTNIRRLIVAGMGLGLAAVAAYLYTSGKDAPLPVIGAVICFFEAL